MSESTFKFYLKFCPVHSFDVAENALSVVKSWQNRKRSFFDVFYNGNRDVSQEVRGVLNESLDLLNKVKTRFQEMPGAANAAWSQDLLLGKLKECADRLKPAFQLGPIVIQSREQKEWQHFINGVLGAVDA